MELTPAQRIEAGKRFDAVLKQRNIGKTEIGKRIGENYLTINRWTHGRGFNEENQRRAAEALGLAPDAFRDPDLAAARERYRKRVFSDFCDTELGRSASEQELRLLDRIPFVEDILPLGKTYVAIFLALANRVPEERVPEILELNKSLIASAKAKGRKIIDD